MTRKNTYENLINTLKKIYPIETTVALLNWDEQVNLPPKSSQQRATQLARLSEIAHNEFIDPQIGKDLEYLESSFNDLSHAEKTNVRETRRNYNRAVKIPAEHVKEKAETDSAAYHAWVKARKNNDFKSYAPFIQKQIDLCKREADYVGHGDNPYNYWIDKHDPYMTKEIIEPLFKELKESLIPIVKQITTSDIKADTTILKGFDVSKQRSFAEQVAAKIGFDFDRGRLDIAVHPFCSGNGADTRMTTRFNENTPLDSLFSTIHETGHGLYEQGLPLQWLGTPLGKAAGMGAHESQSRLWENQVGRSRSFWAYWEKYYRELFKEELKDIDSETLYLTINSVELNPIRVDSDEVTYNLHIILRFELEKQLFEGTLKVEDLPEAWNKASQEIIGLTPKNDAQGVLQDIHWSMGAFGYFPSYTLGNLLAAQLWYTAKKQIPNLESEFEKGEFLTLLEWLRENFHGYGQQYNTQELTEKITGEKLSAKPLIKYLSERYLPLYGLGSKNVAAV